MFEVELFCCLGNAEWFFGIYGEGRGMFYRTKSTVTGADIPQYHKCGGALGKTGAHVGTNGAFTYRVEIETVQHGLHVTETLFTGTLYF
jgi:hypothetical protein